MTTGYSLPNGSWVSTADTPNQGRADGNAPYVQLTASGVVSARPGAVLQGAIVVVALSAAAITIYDNASAASGNVLAVIPASAAVGTVDLPGGITATNGIYASFGGTGTVNFMVN